MQPLPCDGGCGGVGQVLITIVETGDALALCWNCTADWGQQVAAQRDAAQQQQQAGPDGNEGQADDDQPARPARPAPRRAARRRRPATVGQADTPTSGAVPSGASGPGGDDSVEHRPPLSTDLGGYETDDISVGE